MRLISTLTLVHRANIRNASDQLRSITRNTQISSHIPGYDFLIAGIPPLDTTPYHHTLVSDDKDQLELLELLNLQYNQELHAAADSLMSEFKKTKTRSNVFFYDMANLVRVLHSFSSCRASSLIFGFMMTSHRAVEADVRRSGSLSFRPRLGDVPVS